MLHDLIFLILGLVLLIGGANYMTDGAVAVAHRFKVSNLMIGLTVVALGSSMPDIVVCVESALEHKTAIAVGEVVGANIFDLLLVVGIMGIFRPWRVSDLMKRQDLPILAIASIALWVVGDTVIFDGTRHNVLDRSSGIMLIVVFVFYMWLMVITSKSQSQPSLQPASGGKDDATSSGSAKGMKPSMSVESQALHESGIAGAHCVKAEWRILKNKLSVWKNTRWMSWTLIIGGLAALVVGGNCVVDGASGLALKAGMSQGMVALTVVAIGNSLPDLVTSLTATMKGASGIAFGNIVGACIINALLALGLSAAITPLGADTIGFVDFMTLAGASVLLCLLPWLSRKGKITRIEGIFLTLLYAAYMTFTIIRG